MYFLQGLLVGLATFAPVGMQNLFIINTALVQPVRRIILTLIILALFDMSLSAAAFYGIGAVLEIWPITKLIVLIFGGLLIVYMGGNIFRTEPDMRNVDTHIPIKKIIMSAIVVSWGNPQAILDATMMLGAFQANIPKEGIYYFFAGFLTMTPMWFSALATTMHLLAKKIKISHMVWINRFCGTVLTIYGIKLFIDGITMLLEFL
ncbi:LysE family transporter [uncultured Veillonella sp.]|uniref:LysE/ArgO family amino acid transporter n=1 Tax=uncultured Veillonella sp. TaxID=159268 RepID=UPI0028DCE21E|nr:LysE family transporter [uncultured Veillonella sp.]